MVGLGGLEPPTSRLSGVRSNQLSYRPTSRVGAIGARVRRGHPKPSPVLNSAEVRAFEPGKGRIEPGRCSDQADPKPKLQKREE